MAVRLDALRTQRLAAGYSITRLAQLANVSDHIITTLEMTPQAGTTTHLIADRICAAMAISRATAGFVDLG